MERIDITRCRDAMEDLVVQGHSDSPERREAIADAIEAIQQDGEAALSERYIGVKRYAGFGEQREDHKYGFSPKHGSIVFRIARTLDPRTNTSGVRHAVLGEEHIYLLECARDFGDLEVQRVGQPPQRWGLCSVIREWEKVAARFSELNAYLNAQQVESHAVAGR